MSLIGQNDWGWICLHGLAPALLEAFETDTHAGVQLLARLRAARVVGLADQDDG